VVGRQFKMHITMTTRTILIIVGLALTVCAIIGLWLWLTPAPTQELPPPVTLPVVSSTTPVRTESNSTQAAINALLTAPDTTRLGDNDYLLTPAGPTPGKQEEYQITYHAPSRTFVISLLQEPLGATRHAGEQRLLSLLGIGAEEACATLNVNVTVPFSVNEQYAGRNLRMSFCAGETELPE
jgi:hypothetical protein